MPTVVRCTTQTIPTPVKTGEPLGNKALNVSWTKCQTSLSFISSLRGQDRVSASIPVSALAQGHSTKRCWRTVNLSTTTPPPFVLCLSQNVNTETVEIPVFLRAWDDPPGFPLTHCCASMTVCACVHCTHTDLPHVKYPQATPPRSCSFPSERTRGNRLTSRMRIYWKNIHFMSQSDNATWNVNLF